MSSNQLIELLRPTIPSLELGVTEASEVETSLDNAIKQMHISLNDSYDNIVVLSMYWASDNTGAKDDSNLFLQTISQLQPVETVSLCMPDAFDEVEAQCQVTTMLGALSGSRHLFILHYSGHAAENAENKLFLTPKFQSKGDGPEVDFSFVRDLLKRKTEKINGLGVLFVLDCCFASIGGRGKVLRGARVEHIAACSASAITNAREDGHTFTQNFCEAFNILWQKGGPFTSNDIVNEVNKDPQLANHPLLMVLKEGWEIPIKFHPAQQVDTANAAYMNAQIVAAFHLKEDMNSDPYRRLVNYLKRAPVPISILVACPTNSTLVIVRMPAILLEFLNMRRRGAMLILTN